MLVFQLSLKYKICTYSAKKKKKYNTVLSPVIRAKRVYKIHVNVCVNFTKNFMETLKFLAVCKNDCINLNSAVMLK